MTEFTFYGLQRAIDRSRTGKAKVAHNTWAFSQGDFIAVQFHQTVVGRVWPHKVQLFTGGWMTVTTKLRLSWLLPPGWSIYQERGEWWLLYHRTGETYAFAEGVVIFPDGVVDGAKRKEDIKADKDLRQDINTYVKGYIEALLAGEVPAPDNGDCWFCLFRWDKNTSHLDEHLKEPYYVPSLLRNAIEQYPVSQMAGWALNSLWEGETPSKYEKDSLSQQAGSSLTRYLRGQYGLAR